MGDPRVRHFHFHFARLGYKYEIVKRCGMQNQLLRPSEPSIDPIDSSRERCPECGAVIEGIAATGDDHRFVGCGHSARQFSAGGSGPALVSLTVE